MAKTVHRRHGRCGHAKLRHMHQNSDNQRTSYRSKQVRTSPGGFKQVKSGQDGEGKAVTVTHTGNCGLFLFFYSPFPLLSSFLFFFLLFLQSFLLARGEGAADDQRLRQEGRQAGSTRSFPRVDGPPV